MFTFFRAPFSGAHLSRCNKSAKRGENDRMAQAADNLSLATLFKYFYRQKIGGSIFFAYLCLAYKRKEQQNG
jgi:hypothetical protein